MQDFDLALIEFAGRSAVDSVQAEQSELTALATSRETLRTSPAQLRFITMPSK
jgi:hypothetical protein